MRLGLKAALECGACGFEEGHGAFCPMPDIERLKRQQMHALCHQCLAPEVDLNDLGLMECRACHVQYRRVVLPGESALMLTREWVTFRLLSEPGPAAYFIVGVRGSGKFANDRLLKEAEQLFSLMEASRTQPARLH